MYNYRDHLITSRLKLGSKERMSIPNPLYELLICIVGLKKSKHAIHGLFISFYKNRRVG